MRLSNKQAAFTLTYIAQFSEPPSLGRRLDKRLPSKILHLPGNALAEADLFNLHRWGSAQICSVCAASVVALLHGALKTVHWQESIAMRSASDAFPLVDLNEKIYTPRFWDEKPAALIYAQVRFGLCKDTI